MINEHRVKINDLKHAIKVGRESVIDLINTMTQPVTEGEDKEERNKRLREEIAVKKAMMNGHQKELQLVKMNKNDSSFFSWEPHKGMNRQQARKFRRQNKKR